MTLEYNVHYVIKKKALIFVKCVYITKTVLIEYAKDVRLS